MAGTFFIELLDATIITTALPYMARDFSVPPVNLSVGISCYLLSIAVFVPMSGWVTERVGARRTFCGAIIIFTLASLLCGLSRNFWFFVAARVVQGVGGALMVPVGRLLVMRGSSKADLVRMVAIITWPGLTAPILGPPLGGLISQHLSWHWIFFLNLPLGAVALVAALRLVHGGQTSRAPFDWPGFAYISAALCAIIACMEYLAHGADKWWIVGALVLLAAGGTTAGVRHLHRSPHPLFSLDVLEVRSFLISMRGGSAFRIAISAVPLLLPLMYQLAFGFDGFTAGLFVMALFAGNLGIKPATTWLLKRFGFFHILVINGLLIAVGFAAMATLKADTPAWLALSVIAFSGACRSMQFTALNTGAFVEIEKHQMTNANTMSSLVFQVTATVGVGLAALSISAAAAWRGGSASAPTAADFHISFVCLAVLALLGTFDIAKLPRDFGRQVSGHKQDAT